MTKKNKRPGAPRRKRTPGDAGSSAPEHLAHSYQESSKKALEFLNDPKNADRLAEIAKSLHPSSWRREDIEGPLFVDPQESLIDRSLDGWANACMLWDGLTTELVCNGRLSEQDARRLGTLTDEIAFCASGWDIPATGLRELGADIADLEFGDSKVDLSVFIAHMKAADLVVAEVRERAKAHAMRAAGRREPGDRQEGAPEADLARRTPRRREEPSVAAACPTFKAAELSAAGRAVVVVLEAARRQAPPSALSAGEIKTRAARIKEQSAGKHSFRNEDHVRRTVYALRTKGWPIPNSRNGAGYRLDAPLSALCPDLWVTDD